MTSMLCGTWACAPGEPPNLVRRSIGPDGGLITSHDGVLTIVLQPGALERTISIEIFPSDEPPVIFGPAYRVRPDIDLVVDAEVTYRRVFPNDPSGVAVAAIRTSDYEAEIGHWRPLPSLHVDLAAEEIIAADDALSLYYGMLANGGGSGGDGSGGADDGSMASSGGISGTHTSTGASIGSSTGDASATAEDDTAVTEDTGVDACGDGDAAAGEICFAPGVAHAMGAGPLGVVVGDFDGDGDLDVATADGEAATVTVRFGDGSGGLGAPATIDLVGNPGAIAAGDPDNDGDDDLVVVIPADDAVVAIGSNSGAFAVQPALDVGAGPVDLSLRHLDADDRLDLVVLSAGAAELATFLTTDAGFGPTGTVPLNGLSAPAVSLVTSTFNDLDDDGPDGDAFALGGDRFQGFDGTGSGALNPLATITATAGRDLGKAWAGTIGGNIQNDIVVVDRASGGVIVLVGDGHAVFAPQPLLATGPSPVDVVVADVTGDGAPDILVADADGDTVTVLARTGALAWQQVADLAVGAQPSAIDVGDLDGDGVVDIVVANAADDGVTVLLSNP